MSIKIVGESIEPNNVQFDVHQFATTVARSLTEFDFQSGELHVISHYVNTIFCFMTDSGRYAIRLHRSSNRTRSEVESEMAWLDALRLADGLRVPNVRKTNEDETVLMVAVANSEREIPMTILEWVPGRTIRDKKDLQHFEKLGKMTGALHRHAQTWSPPSSFDRPTYDSNHLLLDDISVRLEELISSTEAELLRRALMRLEERLRSTESELGRTSQTFGMIHGDLSFGNVLFNDDETVPIDFDECGFGYFLHDLSVPLAGAWQKPNFEKRYQAFIKGYRQILELPGDLLRYVPVFLGLRSFQLIRDYVGRVPWKEGILDQYRTRLSPALESCDSWTDWIR